MSRARPALLAAAGLVLLVMTWPARAHAVDRNFAGSAQLDYHIAPTEPAQVTRESGINGFTLEAAFKVAADVSDRLSANAKVCWGCHGFELAMAYFDLRLHDALNIRAGRFSPNFGAFNLRHDPANHAFSSKPLPYDMGRMRRMNEWNLGVLPSPFPDNGVEVGGSHWFGERLAVDYSIYAVTGFKAETGSLDLDWSRSLAGFASLENNRWPTVGGRLAFTLRLGLESDATIGGSAMHGPYDDFDRFDYNIFGGDLSLRIGSVHLRAEYLVRQHQFVALEGKPLMLPRTPGTRGVIAKHGAYAELLVPAAPWLELAGRVDGLHRRGNALADGPLGTRATVFRYSLGTVWVLAEGLRLKTSAEVWAFSEDFGSPAQTELGLHAAAVGTF